MGGGGEGGICFSRIANLLTQHELGQKRAMGPHRGGREMGRWGDTSLSRDLGRYPGEGEA